MEPVQLLAYVRVENDLLIADALQLGNELWLVTEWNETETPDGRFQTPARAIRIDQWHPQMEPTQGADLVLAVPLSKAAFAGRAPLPTGTVCVSAGQAESHFGWMRVQRTN